MTLDRNLRWDGCHNTRDLGGLPTTHGRTTRWGAVVRSDAPDHLTAAGWAALAAHGIRTIIDLRNDQERPPDPALPVDGLTVVHVPLDDAADRQFWEHVRAGDLDGSPLYYQPFLDRKPQRCATAVAAVADAPPGGVLVHCGIGRDRTGLVSLLLLALVGVAPEVIVADYELSNARLRPLWAARGERDWGLVIQEVLARRRTTTRELLHDLLAVLDADAYLRAAGLGTDALTAIRARLLRPPEHDQEPD